MELLAGCENAWFSRQGPHTLGTSESPGGPAAGPQPIVSDSVGLGQDLLTCVSNRLQTVLRKLTQRTQRTQRERAIRKLGDRNGVWRGTVASETRKGHCGQELRHHGAGGAVTQVCAAGSVLSPSPGPTLTLRVSPWKPC